MLLPLTASQWRLSRSRHALSPNKEVGIGRHHELPFKGANWQRLLADAIGDFAGGFGKERLLFILSERLRGTTLHR